jgi:hypothetical protein
LGFARRVRDHDDAEWDDGDCQGFCLNPFDDDDLLSAPSKDNIAEKSGQKFKVFLKTRRLLCYLNYDNGRNRGQKPF